MKIEVEIGDYSKDKGLLLKWKDGYNIKIEATDNSVSILANSAGLVSLANHLLNLAQIDVAVGTHIHLDEDNSLEVGSIDLVIEKSE